MCCKPQRPGEEEEEEEEKEEEEESVITDMRTAVS